MLSEKRHLYSGVPTQSVSTMSGSEHRTKKVNVNVKVEINDGKTNLTRFFSSSYIPCCFPPCPGLVLGEFLLVSSNLGTQVEKGGGADIFAFAL